MNIELREANDDLTTVINKIFYPQAKKQIILQNAVYHLPL